MLLKNTPPKIVERAFVQASTTNDQDIAGAIRAQLSDQSFAMILFMVTPEVDTQVFCQSLKLNFLCSHLIGVRTAGEIVEKGYGDGWVVALAFPEDHFAVKIQMCDDISKLDPTVVANKVIHARHALADKHPQLPREFSLVFIDGLSRREEALVSMIAPALGTTQLIGGSSGDGLRFQEAPVFYNDQIATKSAIYLNIRTDCDFTIFREDHLSASASQLVITGVVTEERLVTEINAEPAAQEYGRVVGIDPNQLSPFIFAAHPILISVGNQHHVRSIQKIEENRSLRFFCSMDEGLVLKVANAKDIVEHLQSVMDKLTYQREPDLIFACDCILRKLEATQVHALNKMSQILSRYGVVGFSTYGEQHNMLHVNQTLTGVAIYPPPI